MTFADPADIRRLLETSKSIAVVGLSPDRMRASFHVAAYLKEQGYIIVPVNPAHTEILGETSYPTLAAIPFPVDLVDVFRRSEFVPEIVEQSIAAGAKGIWLQEDVVNEPAARRARE